MRAHKSVRNTVIGIYAKNLQRIPGRNIIGRNATSVVAVPLIRGLLRSRTARIVEFFRLYQSRCLSADHSIITIIVSIAIHKVNTSEKFVRKLSENQIIFNTMNVIKNASGRRIDAIIDSLKPTKTKIVINTSTSVCSAVFHRFL